MKPRNNLTEGPIAKKLTSLTIPMIFGMLSMVIFNLVDTFFVSRLGTQELAAMGFTFPVVMFVTSVALGLGVATASVVSRAIGRGDHHQVRRLTTDSIVISLIVVVIFAVIGLITMDWVFRILGAEKDILSLVKQYMKIWYFGVAFVVIPMVGNNAIRACGDTLFPSLIMIFSTLINVILDPLLIFGLGGFPRMELAGAALATVIARAGALVLSFLVLHYKEKLLDFSLPPLAELKDSLGQIFYIGIPSAATRLLLPVTMAVIMRMVAGFGAAAVAAFGVAIKVEMFVFMVVMALATALVPFIGQNWGAKRFERVKEAIHCANKFSIWWGIGHFVLFIFLALPLGYLFSKDPEVSKIITYYLWIIPVSYGLRGTSFLSISAFNAINKPLVATGLNLVRMFLLYIPFAYFGSLINGLFGLFCGLCLANIIAGLIAIYWNRRIYRSYYIS